MGFMEELKSLIISELKIDDITPEEIEDDAPLFGDGLGLDSLDAVELVVILQKHYGVKLNDMEKAKEAFASVKSLADFIQESRVHPS